MLNFNSLNKTEKDILLSHNTVYKNLMTSIRDDSDKLFNEYIKGADLSVDDGLLLKYAAMKGRKRMLRVMLNTATVVDRPVLLTSILTGGNLELLELFGDIDPEDDLSPETLAICANMGHTDMFKQLFDLASNKYREKYNLVSIAIRAGSIDIVKFLTENNYIFSKYDAIISACAVDSVECISYILAGMTDLIDEGTYVDGAIIAATYGHSDALKCMIDPTCNVDARNNAIIKSAMHSENIDTIKYIIGCGANLDFDDGLILPIAAGLEGVDKKGNLEVFKLILETSGVSFSARDGLALKTAEAYGRDLITEYIKSLDIE